MLSGIILAAAAAASLPAASAIDPGSWFTANAYPPEALKKHIQGQVGFEADVDPWGRPTACRVTSSSGSPILDQATCAIVQSKGRFKPAKDPSGAAVPGQYSNRAVWRLADGPRWAADFLDLSDPANPMCRTQSEGSPVIGPSCARLLQETVALPELARRLTKLVYFTSVAFGEDQPYAGDPRWGNRISDLASDRYLFRGGTDCVSIAAEGLAAGRDPCADFKTGGKLSEADRKRALKIHSEVAMFGIRRTDAVAPGTCKKGESKAEVESCD